MHTMFKNILYLYNLIGGKYFTQTHMIANLIGKQSARRKSNLSMHQPESRLKARNGQDRSVVLNARETDKGFPQGMIYSPTLHYTQNVRLTNVWDSFQF